MAYIKTLKYTLVNLALLILLASLLVCCKKHKPNKYSSIEVYNRQQNTFLKKITNQDTISNFEEALRDTKKVNALKTSDTYKYILKCNTPENTQYYLILNDTISKNDGQHISKSSFSKILNVK